MALTAITAEQNSAISQLLTFGDKTADSQDPLVNVLNNALKGVTERLKELDTGSDISEIEMMQLNVAVSRFNTFVTLASGIIKNLCDGEKTIAQKM
ncbi:MAG: hypothetical protein LUC93_14575 [Planctomycetaceae bacterium]|nr:hypothetical protein [Planctomycetaceae bacterium]